MFGLLPLTVGASPLHLYSEPKVYSAHVVLKDVVDLSRLSPNIRQRVSEIPVFELRADQQEFRISKQDLAQYVRRQVPGLIVWSFKADDGSVMIHRMDKPSSSPALSSTGQPPVACMEVIRPIAAGVALTADDVAPAVCPGSSVDRRVRYDRSMRLARSTRDLLPGDIIGRVPDFALARIRTGEIVRLRSQVGTVIVERKVMALQPGRTGKQFFVKADDGNIFSVTSLEVTP